MIIFSTSFVVPEGSEYHNPVSERLPATQIPPAE
jgi:hypothetical protein